VETALHTRLHQTQEAAAQLQAAEALVAKEQVTLQRMHQCVQSAIKHLSQKLAVNSSRQQVRGGFGGEKLRQSRHSGMTGQLLPPLPPPPPAEHGNGYKFVDRLLFPSRFLTEHRLQVPRNGYTHVHKLKRKRCWNLIQRWVSDASTHP